VSDKPELIEREKAVAALEAEKMKEPQDEGDAVWDYALNEAIDILRALPAARLANTREGPDNE